jgi:MYXO-CTERM domain-containing protein
MRKTLGITLTTAALMFGGAGVANATAPNAPVPSSTTTTLADDNNNNNNAKQDSDKTGLWGLAGLLGLVGLVGLKRRNDTGVASGTAAHAPNNPRM